MTLRLHVTVDGRDDADALVLGPSLGTDTSVFDAQVAAFADRFRVVRYDLPGHGRSPDPDGPVTVADLAEGVLDALEELAVDRFHYAGVSLGGAVGQWLAVHSERLRSLAVMASAARFPDPDSWAARADLVRRQGTAVMVASRQGVWYTDRFAHERAAHARALLDVLRATRTTGYAACSEAVGTFDVRGDLHRVAVPTLVVAGEDDPATPVGTVRVVADGVPGATFVVLPGAHLVNVESPRRVNEVLAAHLERGVRDRSGGS